MATQHWKARVIRLVRAVAVARAWQDFIADTHPDLARARAAALRERELGCALVPLRRLDAVPATGMTVALALLLPRLLGFRPGSWLVDRELHRALRSAHRHVPPSQRAELERATRFIGLFRSSPAPACAPMGPVPPPGR